MLVRIFLIVLIVFILLWAFLEWTKRFPLKNRKENKKTVYENFEGETVEYPVGPIPPVASDYKELSAGEILMGALGDLPQEEKQQATETHQESQVDLSKTLSEMTNTQSEMEAITKRPVIVTQQTNQFNRQVQPRARPNRPLWQQIRDSRNTKQTQRRISVLSSRIPRRVNPVTPQAGPAPDSKTMEYALMMGELEGNAYDKCYIDNCQPVQEYIQESCKGFTPECTIQELQNIENCMYSYADRCDESELEQCKQYCRNDWSSRSSRTELVQDDYMDSNDRITSPDGQTVLVLRDSGEIELYYKMEKIWNSNTGRGEIGGGTDKGPFTLRMHGNGDLVLSNQLGLEVWHSNTWMEPLGAGFMNAPYVMKMGPGYFYIENKLKQIIWKNTTSLL